MDRRDLFKWLASIVALLMVCCSKGETSSRSFSLPAASPTPVATINSSIRSVDFSEIAYPNLPDYAGPKAKRITLKPGEGAPNFINYGDVTGDGIEDAIVVLELETRGSAVPDYVYIFTMEQGRPKLVWDFEAGDRADGGLRQVYADKGQLVIELYGKDRFIGGHLYKGDEALCCPGFFTRTRYKWTGKRFEEIIKEVLVNPSGDANPIMPHYSAAK